MKLTDKQLKLLKQCFKKEPLVKLAYLFGSQATGDAGPLSDYDFAVYADTKDSKESFYLKCGLNGSICEILNTDKVDVVMLNSSTGPLIKYMAVSEGIVIYEQEPYRVFIEPKIFNEFFDYKISMVRHGLTKAI
ncbi:nucleotidyltransferase domain-containing protein [Patescibacteria group bacterium]|nr:nucleotidyltransferase domain-containing protein [Patescibacteria group bacterium]